VPSQGRWRRAKRLVRTTASRSCRTYEAGGFVAKVITLRAVPGISAEIVLAVDGEWLKTRLFRSHEQAELVSAVADTRALFEAKEWK
jgi:hypothetical protein